MKTCPMHLWTDLRRLNPYRFAQRTFHLDPRFGLSHSLLCGMITMTRLLWTPL
jgi:hypothetical protein